MGSQVGTAFSPLPPGSKAGWYGGGAQQRREVHGVLVRKQREIKGGGRQIDPSRPLSPVTHLLGSDFTSKHHI